MFKDSEDIGLAPLFYPGTLWELITVVNEFGVWGMGSSGENITGVMLWIVWLVEAVLIVGMAFYICRLMANGVFCERCNAWADEQDDVTRLEAGESAPDEELE